MSLNTSYTLINPSFFGESRVLFEPFTKNTDYNATTQKVGVRTHCWLTALILGLFGKIETVRMSTGETLYLNKGSVTNWLERHGEHSQDALVERITRVCKQAFPVQQEKIDLPKKQKEEPKEIKEALPNPPLPPLADEIEEEKDVKVEANKAELNKLIDDIKMPDFSFVVAKPIKVPTFEERYQQDLKKCEFIKKIVKRWKAYAKRAEKRAQLHDRYLKSAQERIKERKIFEYAKIHVPRVEALIYTPEGELKNLVEEEKSRSRLSEFKNDIEKSRQEAEKLHQELEGLEEGEVKEKKLADIQDYEEEVARWPKKEEKWLKSIENMQKTLFPVKIDGRQISVEQMIEDCPANEWHEKHVYHGTSTLRAHYARENGFEKSFPSKRILDAGSATYFAFESQSAVEGYAKKKEEGVLICSVKLNKVAKIKDYGGLWFLVEEFFLPLTRAYTNKNQTEILQALNDLGIASPTDFNIFEHKSIFQRHLTNELTKLFFQKMGYDGIHVLHSSRAGCGYLAVFEPEEENVQVLSLEKTKEYLKAERDRLEERKQKLLVNAQA